MPHRFYVFVIIQHHCETFLATAVMFTGQRASRGDLAILSLPWVCSWIRKPTYSLATYDSFCLVTVDSVSISINGVECALKGKALVDRGRRFVTLCTWHQPYFHSNFGPQQDLQLNQKAGSAASSAGFQTQSQLHTTARLSQLMVLGELLCGPVDPTCSLNSHAQVIGHHLTSLRPANPAQRPSLLVHMECYVITTGVIMTCASC
jgi:hypothetical protein